MPGIPDMATIQKVIKNKKDNGIKVAEKINIFGEEAGKITKAMLVNSLVALTGKEPAKNIKIATLFTKIGEAMAKAEKKDKNTPEDDGEDLPTEQ